MEKIIVLSIVLAAALFSTPSAKAQFTTASAIDCSRYPGAPDMGLQITNCMAAAPATGAIYDTTHFTSPQMISTPIVMNKPGVITSCAITIFQRAGISMTVRSAAWSGCPDKSTELIKSANIDQFTITSEFNTVSNLDLEGSKSKYTGNGIVLDNTSGRQQQATISDNLINAEAEDAILNISGWYNRVSGNNIQGYGTHAVDVNGALFVSISDNMITGAGDETSSSIYAHGNCQVSISGNRVIENLAGFPAIDGLTCANLRITSNTFVASPDGIAIAVAGPGEISDNYIVGQTALEVEGGDGTAQKNTMVGNGNHAVILNGANQYVFSGNVVGLIRPRRRPLRNKHYGRYSRSSGNREYGEPHLHRYGRLRSMYHSNRRPHAE